MTRCLVATGLFGVHDAGSLPWVYTAVFERLRMASSLKLLQRNDAMRERQRRKHAAVSIQSVWKLLPLSNKIRRSRKSVLMVQSDATTTIQSVWRAFNARRILHSSEIFYRRPVGRHCNYSIRLESLSARKEYEYQRSAPCNDLSRHARGRKSQRLHRSESLFYNGAASRHNTTRLLAIALMGAIFP
jgi:hypothetical protein